jgi:NAD(P)-dependent dehydrogenase (short-subunit alcohol dehydrogenase family)
MRRSHEVTELPAPTRCHELEAAVWRRTVDVNLTGAFLTCKHALRAMLAQGGGGSLVLTGSPTGLLGCAPGFSAYSASKAGVHGLMRVLAADYAGEGIRVNAVVPGFTDTPLVVGIDPEDRVRLLASIPLGRQGAAEEVASMMVFLASDESRYCTGGFYMVDGGLTSV